MKTVAMFTIWGDNNTGGKKNQTTKKPETDIKTNNKQKLSTMGKMNIGPNRMRTFADHKSREKYCQDRKNKAHHCTCTVKSRGGLFGIGGGLLGRGGSRVGAAGISVTGIDSFGRCTASFSFLSFGLTVLRGSTHCSPARPARRYTSAVMSRYAPQRTVGIWK